jgi:hypothetical protein
MALLGNGINNGSPFYAGYEYQAPNLVKPTGLLTAASFMGKGVAAASTDEKTKKEDIDKTVVAGTLGTSKDLTALLNNTDASITQLKAQMRSKMANSKYSGNEMIAEVKDEAQTLTSLYDQKHKLEAQLPAANTDLMRFNDSYEAHRTKGALGLPAMELVDGVYMPVGVNDKTKDLATYEDAFAAKNEESHLAATKDVYGGISFGINTGTYYNTPDQKDKFGIEVAAAYNNAKGTINKSKWENPVGLNLTNPDKNTSAYLIQSGYYNDNNDAMQNVVKTLYEGLSSDARADIAAKMSYDVFHGVKDGNVDMKTGLVGSDGKAILEPEQVVSINKIVNKTGTITDADKLNYKHGLLNYATAKIQGQLPSYLVKESDDGTKLSDSGVTKDKRIQTAIIDENVNAIIPNGAGMSGGLMTFNTKSVNFGDKPVSMSIADKGTMFDPKTGLELERNTAHTNIQVNKIYGVKNPNNGKVELWVNGVTYNPNQKAFMLTDDNKVQFNNADEFATYKEDHSDAEIKANPDFSVPTEFAKQYTPAMKSVVDRDYLIDYKELKDVPAQGPDAKAATTIYTKSYTLKDGSSFTGQQLKDAGWNDSQIGGLK